MPFSYLPIFVQKAAPKPARTLVYPSRNAWHAEVPPLTSAKIALLTSSAIRTPDQPPFTPPEDASYRAVPAEPNATDLFMDHRSPLGTDPRKDPEVVFPRSALNALAERGLVSGVSASHYSFVGGTLNHTGVENDLAPGLVRELRQQDVNLALLVPFWPYCHETGGLLANAIEALGIPTLVIGTVRDIMEEVRSPRAVFVDYPAGRTFGHPHATEEHQRILAAALDELAYFTAPGQIRDLPFQWDRDGKRSWEVALREELMGPPFAEPARSKRIRPA